MLLFSSRLEDHINRDRIVIEHDGSSVTYMDWQVVSALEDWTTSGSQILCIVGPNQAVDMSPTTMVATQYMVSANQANIPIISYFCELPRPRTKLPRGMTAEMSGLVSLIYALIRQLIELLPSFMSCTEGLGEQRFTKLDGRVDSLDEAIAVLGELLDLSPPMLFCVIDGFETLDDRSTTKHMTAFVNTLRGHKIYRSPLSKGSDRVLKILLTTAGRSRNLLADLKDEELVFAERASSAQNPGRPSAGRRSLSPTPLEALKHVASP